MPCKYDKNALIEAAAASVDLANAPDSNPELATLRAHLEFCAECRAAFAVEQSLFSSIDAGLRASAKSEFPLSLLPRVRARLHGEAAPKGNLFRNQLVFATAGAVILVFLAARTLLRSNHGQTREEAVATTSVSAPNPPPSQTHVQNLKPAADENASVLPQNIIARNLVGLRPIPGSNTMPEVLVPRDQEVLLARYAEQWRLRRRPPLVTADSGETTLEPLQVDAIQIAQLDVKLLAEEKSQ